MNKLILFLMLLFTLPAFACDFSRVPNLTATQRVALEADCKAAQTANTTVPDSTAQTIRNAVSPDALSDYGQVAQEFAKAIGIAAKELGVAANEFLDTPAGKLTAVVIVWKVMGEDIFTIASYPFKFLTGLLLLCILWYHVRKLRSVVAPVDTTYESVPMFWGLFSYRRKVKVAAAAKNVSMSEDGAAMILGWGYTIAVIATLIITAVLLIP